MFDCANGIYVDVQSYPAFATVNVTDPIDASKNFVSRNNYSPGGPGDIVVVRLFYQWPMFVTGLGYNIANLSGSKRLLTATAAFQNEPYLADMQSHETDDENLASHAALGARAVRRSQRCRGGRIRMIVPLMLVLFFGTVEFSSGVAVDRKVTLMARTLSDLTSQNDLGHRHRADQLLQRQHGDHDAVFGGAGQIHDHANCMSIPRRMMARVQWSKGDRAARGRHRRSRSRPRCRSATPI